MDRRRLIPFVSVVLAGALLAVELLSPGVNWFWVVLAGCALLLGLVGLLAGGGGTRT